MNHVLLVDDEINVLKALKRTLHSHFGWALKLEIFTDPSLALTRAREKTFDVIVSDYRMPQMTGIEFLTAVRGYQPQAVRMILSASTEAEVLMKAVNETEVFRYLTKPWKEDELVEQLRAALQRSTEAGTERRLADLARVQSGNLSKADFELRRLEEQEPGLTHVDWGPNGEVLMPPLEPEIKKS